MYMLTFIPKSNGHTQIRSLWTPPDQHNSYTLDFDYSDSVANPGMFRVIDIASSVATEQSTCSTKAAWIVFMQNLQLMSVALKSSKHVPKEIFINVEHN